MLGPIAVQVKAKVAKKKSQKLVKDISKLQQTEQLNKEDLKTDENETSSNVHMVYKCLEKKPRYTIF
jgi:hypothetical protein